MRSAAADPLSEWRRVDRLATRIAVVTASATVVAMLVGALLPLLVGDVAIRTLLAAYYNGTQADWNWDFSAADAWWAIGLVLLVPVLATLVGALRARRRLSHATQHMPADVDLSTIGPAVTEGQRAARARSLQSDLGARRERFAQQNRSRLPVLSTLGAAFAILLGGWLLIAIALDLAGATSTPVGAWIATYSWWLMVAGLVVWSVIVHLIGRRRTRETAGVEAPSR
jgi:hypothetical protein